MSRRCHSCRQREDRTLWRCHYCAAFVVCRCVDNAILVIRLFVSWYECTPSNTQTARTFSTNGQQFFSRWGASPLRSRQSSLDAQRTALRGGDARFHYFSFQHAQQSLVVAAAVIDSVQVLPPTASQLVGEYSQRAGCFLLCYSSDSIVPRSECSNAYNAAVLHVAE